MSQEEDHDDAPVPNGELALQTVAMPSDTNANGDIFGGWLLSQMDIAGSISARKLARGRVATVAIDSMAFYTPAHVGAVSRCPTAVPESGRATTQINAEE